MVQSSEEDNFTIIHDLSTFLDIGIQLLKLKLEIFFFMEGQRYT